MKKLWFAVGVALSTICGIAFLTLTIVLSTLYFRYPDMTALRFSITFWKEGLALILAAIGFIVGTFMVCENGA